MFIIKLKNEQNHVNSQFFSFPNYSIDTQLNWVEVTTLEARFARKTRGLRLFSNSQNSEIGPVCLKFTRCLEYQSESSK